MILIWQKILICKLIFHHDCYLTKCSIFSGSPRDYLEAYIFPVLLPALEEMLKQAKTEKCFEVDYPL
jgi:hypothetical protein